jgi:ABC-type proline/glycine betaine transport system permease subunit
LGSILNRGIRTQNMQMILSGTGALMLIAIILDGIMGVLEKRLAGEPRRAHQKSSGTGSGFWQ